VPIPTTANADTTAHAHLCNGAATLLPWKLLQTILSLVQASCRLLFAAPAVPTLGRPTTSRSRRQSKSKLAQNVVAAALLDKHHLIINHSCGPIQLVYGFC